MQIKSVLSRRYFLNQDVPFLEVFGEVQFVLPNMLAKVDDKKNCFC